MPLRDPCRLRTSCYLKRFCAASGKMQGMLRTVQLTSCQGRPESSESSTNAAPLRPLLPLVGPERVC